MAEDIESGKRRPSLGAYLRRWIAFRPSWSEHVAGSSVRSVALEFLRDPVFLILPLGGRWGGPNPGYVAATVARVTGGNAEAQEARDRLAAAIVLAGRWRQKGAIAGVLLTGAAAVAVGRSALSRGSPQSGPGIAESASQDAFLDEQLSLMHSLLQSNADDAKGPGEGLV